MGIRPIRVVGTRKITAEEAVSNIDPDDLTWDADGDFSIATVTEIDPADEEKMSSAKLAAVQALSRAVERLEPAEHALFLAMSEHLDDKDGAIARRLEGRSPFLICDVVLPHHRWRTAVDGAFVAFLHAVGVRHLGASIGRKHVQFLLDRDSRIYQVPVGDVIGNAARCHVFTTRLADDVVPANLTPHIDLRIDLRELSAIHLAGAIDAAFETTGTVWTGRPATAFGAIAFNAACARAPDAASVQPLLEVLADAADEEDRKVIAKESGTTTTKTRKAQDVEVLRPTAPRVEDLHGYGKAALWALDLADDVAAYARGEIGWSAVDAGCLLYGPPGTGKTMLASAIAATAGVAFIPTSYADWQSRGTGWGSDVVRTIRSIFEAANANAPCVVFIDEVDTVRARGGGGHNEDWWSMVTSALLEQLDGSNRREGVVVIGACNHPDRLDPAMVRSGRLDRRFEIGLPDEPALHGILRHHLPEIDPVSLAPAATVLVGSASGADVARFAREARRAARRERREVTAEDLLVVAMPPDGLSPEDRRLVAIHESGHAIAVMLLGRIPESVSIVSDGITRGGVRAGSLIGMARLRDYENEVVVRLGGRAAEEVILGEASGGAEADLHGATSVVAQLIGRTGLAGRLVFDERVDIAVLETKLRELYGRTLRLIGQHRAAVEALADLVVERRVLGKAALEAFAAEHGLGGSR
ncbi:hypothetical protein GCM10011390_03450 [Aureimonas endophytica]|uniref:AAA+ ATPase domain-containing protein n=1 Tax=Aureimonas endophytica TaxID=2027858 RepID=A0A917E069_9HYPH|nr:AAA family ATPase [Aureimonas endophytica]GGD87989.1 hypothetical protein GCM10011390_03450 [Aureimonas endophytica]